MANAGEPAREVNLSGRRSFLSVFNSSVKELFIPDTPFREFRQQPPLRRAKRYLQYFIPIFQWLPRYNLRLFRYDLLAGITITSLAIPQGISYAKLADIPVIIGLYSSFVPPLVYAAFGSSRHLAIGPVAAASVLIAGTIGDRVSPIDNPTLYVSLILTSAFITGMFETTLGLLRLGILVDFLSRSTIVGFMGGTAILICLQQLKGMFGMTHFTTKTDLVSVIRSIISHRGEWRWESAVMGACFLSFLLLCKYLKKKNPKMFLLSAMAPMVTVVIGGILANFAHLERHGIQVVGDLKRGLNPISVGRLNFDSDYIGVTLKAGIISAILAMAEGLAIGRSFAMRTNEQIDGNKEMIAFGLMNIAGSFTSCYLTTGPFSKTAVNFSAGCRTAMANVVMSMCMMLTLLFLAPLFSHTPLVTLSAIIMSAMFGLVEYEEAYKLFRVDKFDFVICMVAFLGVTFVRMDVGLLLSIGIAALRALLYLARPAPCKLGRIPNSELFVDLEQYKNADVVSGTMIVHLGSPIYFANSGYVKDKIARWIKDEKNLSGNDLRRIVLDLGGVSAIDMAGIHALCEIDRTAKTNGAKVQLVNPRMEVVEKLAYSGALDSIGKESLFLCIEDALTLERQQK